jgi:diguanylate cyclase (GGDEF)-like protein/PAS domain S-box-containing protein
VLAAQRPTRSAIRSALYVFGALGALVAAVSDSTPVRLAILVTVAVAAIGTLLRGVVRNRPAHAWIWFSFATGSALVVLATVVGGVQRSSDPDGARSMFLSLQFCGHVLLFLAFCGSARIRRRTGDISTILDALILALAIGLFAWRSLLSGAMSSSDVPMLSMFTVALLPGLDVLACAALLRRAFSAERTSASFRMIMIAAGLVTGAHLVSGLSVLDGSALTNHVAFQIGFISLLAAAAGHPSMRQVTEADTITQNKFGVTRIALLALALLDTPLVILLDQGRFDRDNAPLLVGACAMSVIVVVRLISLAREMEQTRQRERRREQRFESLVRNSSDLIVVLDRDYRVTYTSPAVRDMLGFSPADLLGRTALQGFHPDDVDRVRDILDHLGPEATSDLDLVRIGHANGTWQWTEARAVNLIDDPTVNGIVANCRDVTERVIAQALIDESIARQGAIAGLGRVALAAPDAHALTERAAGLIRSTLDVHRCEVLLFDQGAIADAVVAVRDGAGPLEADARPGDRIIDACLAAAEPIQFTDPSPEGALRTTVDLVYADLDAAPSHPESMFPDTVVAPEPQVLAVQVADGAQILGAILTRAGAPRRFTQDEGAFLATMAGTLGLALGRRGAEATAQHQALHDSLTGLPNRALFVDRLSQALARLSRSDRRLAVLFLDIDHFKVINDSLGHSIGDRILTDVAGRLRALIRPGDTVARFGGDEFTVLLDPLHDRAEAEAIAERIRHDVSQAIHVGSATLQPTVSVGIAVAATGTSNAETLLRDADAAMYQAKDRGRNNVAVFDDTMRDRVIHRLQTEIDLPRAIEDGQLMMRYQPIIALADGTAPGVEALVRWQHPELGEIPPDQFIPVAELSGLIGDLDHWVMRHVMAQCAAEHRRLGASAKWYALNISARTIAGRELPSRVAQTLAETGAPPERICLEITESALMHDLEHSIQVLRSLRDLGVGIAVDDFGTGYSSLSYLKRLPASVLKIDGSFIAGLGHDDRDRAIVESIVNLASTLHQIAVAEGVETRAQVDALRDMGCPMAQGYYFGRPVDAVDLEGNSSAPDRHATEPLGLVRSNETRR